MADAQIAIIDGDQTQVVLAPGENPAIVTSIPGPQGPAGAGVPLGGTTNQVLFKQSGTNYDTAWGPITSAMIGDLEIVNADVSASAAIAGTKISPNFGSQNVTTTGTSTAASFIPTSSTAPTNGLYLSAANSVALSTGGNGRLFISSNGTITTSQSVAITGGLATWNAGLNLFSPSSGVGQIAASTDAAGTAGTLIFQTGSERLRITSTGQLSHIGAGSSGSPAVSFSGSAPSNSLVIDSSGNVGIGQSSITAVFGRTVSNTGAAAATYRVAGASTSAYIFTSDGLGYGGILQETNHPFVFGANSAERARIRADGTFEIKGGGTAGSTPAFSVSPSATSNSLVIGSSGLVGIGTTSPGYRLDVSGDIRATNYVYANAAFLGSLLLNVGATDLTLDTSSNSIAFRTGGSERARIDSSGNLGVGVTSPAIASFGNVIRNKAGAGLGAAGYFAEGANSDTWFGIYSGTGTGDSAALVYPSTGSLRIATTTGVGVGGFSEKIRIDSSGRLLVGTSSTSGNIAGNDKLAVVITGDATQGGISVTDYAGVGATVSSYAALRLQRSIGTTDGSFTALTASAWGLGRIEFNGSNGVGFGTGATIEGVADSLAWGNGDHPARLVFSTTADGASSPTERLRITSAGVLQVADAGNIAVGTTTGTKIGTATTQKLGFFNKTPVVQPAAVADATDAASVITQLNALLARMRDLGLIAT